MNRCATLCDRSRGRLFTWLSGSILAAGALLAAANPANAQLHCAKYTEIAKHLSTNHSEVPVSMGLASNGGLVQVFSSKEGETWSIVMVMPNGMSCLLAAGEFWGKPARKPQRPEGLTPCRHDDDGNKLGRLSKALAPGSSDLMIQGRHALHVVQAAPAPHRALLKLNRHTSGRSLNLSPTMLRTVSPGRAQGKASSTAFAAAGESGGSKKASARASSCTCASTGTTRV